jgi:hypothetical protein
VIKMPFLMFCRSGPTQPTNDKIATRLIISFRIELKNNGNAPIDAENCLCALLNRVCTFRAIIPFWDIGQALIKPMRKWLNPSTALAKNGCRSFCGPSDWKLI